MVREAGAAEVHLRSASPPIQWPDYYGIDMPDREKLLAANHPVEEIAKILSVDSMGYLSVRRPLGPWRPPARCGEPAVHRPLLHRRLPHPACWTARSPWGATSWWSASYSFLVDA